MTDHLTPIIRDAMDNVHDMDVTLDDYAAAAAKAVREAVRPLEWHRSHVSGWNGDWHTVPTGYTIRCADENGWKLSSASGFGYTHSDEAAKSAAEADHRARIARAAGWEA